MSVGKELFRRWGEVWTRRDVGRLDELHTPGSRDRTGNPGVTPDTAGMKQFILRLRAAFPGAVFTTEDMVAEDDRVTARWTMRGIHTGEFNEIPAVGKPVNLAGFAFLRIQDGRVAELWHWETLENDLATLPRLGLIPAPG